MGTLAIVTSCWRYGRYLAEWADSILNQPRPPGMVAIFTHGTEGDEALAQAAAARLRASGLRVKHEHEARRLNFGDARNRAVALSDTEWVMHLDADDQLMPHALADIAALADDQADIVAAGYERSGELGSGPRNRTKTYKTIRGLAVLASFAPCSGVSPFRRTLWERSPYRTDLTGGWDTALWIGFGKLGARIVPTRRPIFYYRQHADSIFNTRRKAPWPSHLAGTALQQLREDFTGVSVLVPRGRDDAPERVAAWGWLAARWAALHPEYQVVEGWSHAGVWCKGAAVADALSRARGRVLIVADSDCVPHPDAIRQAVALVQESAAPWVVPHTMVYRLGPLETTEVLARPVDAPVGPIPGAALTRPAYEGFAGGGMVVLTRAAWVATGGIPTAFVGWGAEDEALAVILDTLLGPHQRLPQPLIHLYHPPSPTRESPIAPGFRTNRSLYRRFLSVRGQPDLLWPMLTSGVGTARPTYWETTDRLSTLTAHVPTAASGAAHMTRDDFAERRLARAHQMRSNPMAGALEVRREHARIRQEQEARNREAVQASLVAQAALPVKMVRDTTENKMRSPEQDKALTVAFSKPQTRAAALAADLTDEDFEHLEPGPRGYTMTHVRQVLA